MIESIVLKGLHGSTFEVTAGSDNVTISSSEKTAEPLVIPLADMAEAGPILMQMARQRMTEQQRQAYAARMGYEHSCGDCE